MVDSYVVLDLEMSGLNPKRDKIVEIGALKVVDHQVVDTFSRLVNPRMKLDKKILELTGICEKDLKKALGIEVVFPEFFDFCESFPIMGHHVILDYSFLKKAAVNQGYPFEKSGIDTLGLCRAFLPKEMKKTLKEACRYFHIPAGEAHRALSDATATQFLYQKLCEHFFQGNEQAFCEKPLVYQTKREHPATKRQKEYLRDLLKYHKITVSLEIDCLSRNEASRLTDKIILQYGTYKRGEYYDKF